MRRNVAVFDRALPDGSLLQRGHLELVLDEQFCEGSSPTQFGTAGSLSLTLYVNDDHGDHGESNTFATGIPVDTRAEIKNKLLEKFMDRLQDHYKVSSFAKVGEVDPQTLDQFRAEVIYATPSWVD